MKLKNLLVVVACFVATGVSAQVAIGGDEPAEGAILDLSGASNLGLLLPQVTAVPPATDSDLCKAGMMVYNTTDQRVYTYDEPNTTWIAGATQADITAAASNLVRSDYLKTINEEEIVGSGNITIIGPAGAVGPIGPAGAQGIPFDTLATTTKRGLMTAADKLKLDALSSPTTGGNSFSEFYENTARSGNWSTANSFCAGLVIGWRLPTAGEGLNAQLSGPFLPTQQSSLWTSSTLPDGKKMITRFNAVASMPQELGWYDTSRTDFYYICVR
jgi:hypothetical protein